MGPGHSYRLACVGARHSSQDLTTCFISGRVGVQGCALVSYPWGGKTGFFQAPNFKNLSFSKKDIRKQLVQKFNRQKLISCYYESTTQTDTRKENKRWKLLNQTAHERR